MYDLWSVQSTCAVSHTRASVDIEGYVRRDKKNTYTLLCILQLISGLFSAVYIFFAAIQMPGMRLYWVEYGSSWCCDRVITGCQRGEL